MNSSKFDLEYYPVSGDTLLVYRDEKGNRIVLGDKERDDFRGMTTEEIEQKLISSDLNLDGVYKGE